MFVRISRVSKKMTQYQIKATYYRYKIPRFLWWIPFYKFSSFADNVLSGKNGSTYSYYNEIEFNSDAAFKGNTLLLISGITASSATRFAYLFKRNIAKGVIIGRETGDIISFNGNPQYLFLPRTGIAIAVPITGNHGKRPILHGVIPHIQYRNVRNQDSVYNFILQKQFR